LLSDLILLAVLDHEATHGLAIFTARPGRMA
jgi:hypothetical protein